MVSGDVGSEGMLIETAAGLAGVLSPGLAASLAQELAPGMATGLIANLEFRFDELRRDLVPRFDALLGLKLESAFL